MTRHAGEFLFRKKKPGNTGIGTYVIKDVCPTSGVIDIYMNSYDECIQFGRQTANVYT